MTHTLTCDADRGAERGIPAGKNRLVIVSGKERVWVWRIINAPYLLKRNFTTEALRTQRKPFLDMKSMPFYVFNVLPQ